MFVKFPERMTIDVSERELHPAGVRSRIWRGSFDAPTLLVGTFVVAVRLVTSVIATNKARHTGTDPFCGFAAASRACGRVRPP
jgi:hypothetical protein